jgi:hypothetical protein
MPSATRRRPPSDVEQFDTDDMPSEMLADDEDVAGELLDEELGDDDDEGIGGTWTSILTGFVSSLIFVWLFFGVFAQCFMQLGPS